MLKRGILILFMFILSMSIVAAVDFEFNGTVKYENGTAIENANVSLLIKGSSWADLMQPINQTNASGWFNFTVPADASYTYQLSIFYHNSTTVTHIGKSLPSFPYSEISAVFANTYYLEEAGTINITVKNSTGSIIPNNEFAVQIKDTKLGYPISTTANIGTKNYSMYYVPKGRNYSIMVYPASGSPQTFIPVSYDWSNFTSIVPYNITSNAMSHYNSDTVTVTKEFNLNVTRATIVGNLNYFNMSEIYGWSEMTVMAFLLEPNNIISTLYGKLPFNQSSNYGQSDIYNYTNGTGTFNISIPYAAVESVSVMLFATAKNGSTFYGGYRNITLTNTTVADFNITLYGLLGSNETMNLSHGTGSTMINTTQQTFNLVNATNQSLTNPSAHIETTVDYSSYGSIEFTFMSDLTGTGPANITVPLLNVTGIKEMNIYMNDQAPRRTSRTIAQVVANPNITLKPLNMSAGDINGALAASGISMDIYRSNSTCDVPNPPSACQLSDSSNLGALNMLAAVIGGGRVSFRMSYGGIVVHYVNVDMLASGPPDALFDDTADNSTSSTNGFSAGVRFGSAGPTIYDYVLVAMNYSSGDGGLNESQEVNMSIPYFYGEDSWTTPIWNVTANGTNGTGFAGNYSHYNTYATEWGILMGNTSCTTNYTSSWFNATNPCHIDTANNNIWIRLPHFSGTQPTITGARNNGTVVEAESSSDSTTSSGSSGGSSDDDDETTDDDEEEESTTTTSDDDEEEVVNLETNTDWADTGEITLEEVVEGDAFEFKFTITTEDGEEEEEAHSLIIDEITEDSVTLTIYSDPQEITLMLEESKSVDLNADEINDVLITLHSIEDGKADITIQKIGEWAPVIEEEAKSKLWLWITIAIVAVLLTATIIFFLRKK